ncbi:unnamed protein product [Chondrus crispus]|uniref:GPN-loop GTPase 3 n=1 Tax=Chondrus crispus TaxID=2769 RepID=R7QQD8_CHOCR|nr:unnamed protein product [Chondrus crispus]CDF39963.1 unnamed protein product [Chondrus crispus]|eukprot:XP_005710257.1 unnamed protein product [Chondrus crispus]
MVKFAQVVLGPAGGGKSTYCAELQRYCNDKKRSLHVINLDPVSAISTFFGTNHQTATEP